MDQIYADIAARTGGNIYVGVVGPVRTGKSTLIKRIMEELVIPGISDPYRKERARDFSREVRFPIDVVLVTELADEENEDEWVFPLEGDSADLDDIVRTVFVLSLDSKLLCKEDCKGICQRCGKNLNDGPCSCQKELDPRFAALKQLLEK